MRDKKLGVIDNVLKILPALITSFTALYIYTKWYRQKGSEVIAGECKEILKNILDVRVISYKVMTYDLNTQEIKDELDKIKELSEGYKKSLLFVSNSIEDEQITQEAHNFFKIEYEFYENVVKYFKQTNGQYYLINEKTELVKCYERFNSQSEIILNIVSPLATYRKSVRFKD